MTFDINTSPVKNNGYDDLWRLSRINWLNSDLYIDENVVKPYTSPVISQGRLSILGRELQLQENGLPKQMFSKFSEAIEIENSVQKELFAKEVQFLIDSQPLPKGVTESKVFNNRIENSTTCENDNYSAEIISTLRYEGMMEYSVNVTPKKDFTANDVSLNFYISPLCSQLMHGLGLRASKAQNLSFKWDNQKQQDCIFIGSVNCGMRVKFKA